MVEDLESELTGAPIYAANSENAALVEVANSGEAITAVSKAIN